MESVFYKGKLQGIFQCFTGTEFRSFSSSDGQRLAGFRVAALTFCAFANVESTETDQSYGVRLFSERWLQHW